MIPAPVPLTKVGQLSVTLLQSEHIGQLATPHHRHDRRLGGIGRVVPIDTAGVCVLVVGA